MIDLKINPEAQVVVKSHGTPVRLHTGVTNIDVRGSGEDALLGHGHKPVLDIAFECTIKHAVGGGEERGHGDTGVGVLALVQLPAVFAEEAVDGSDGAVGPANGDLATLPLEPEHQLLGGRRGGVALGVRGHEVVDDVALVGRRVADGPGVGRGDGRDAVERGLEVLGQPDEGVALDDVGADGLVNVPDAAPVHGLAVVFAARRRVVPRAARAADGRVVVVHRVHDPRRAAQDLVRVGLAAVAVGERLGRDHGTGGGSGGGGADDGADNRAGGDRRGRSSRGGHDFTRDAGLGGGDGLGRRGGLADSGGTGNALAHSSSGSGGDLTHSRSRAGDNFTRNRSRTGDDLTDDNSR